MKSVKWMARNHVAANLLMLVFLVGGVIAALSVKVEVFPEVELDRVTVSVIYPGAGPEEVEDGVVRPIEEAVNGVDGVKRVIANAAEGGASVVVELIEGTNADVALADVKAAVDRIVTFPKEIERPIVKKLVNRVDVVSVVVYGDMSRHALRQRTERIRDDLLALPNITQVELRGMPPYEIAVEISEETLRRYNLTLDAVAAAIRSTSLDLPGGTIKTRGGEILLRTKERRYTAAEYRDVVVISKPDGTLVRLKDIAKIKDTFEETNEAATFNGKPAAMVQVFRVGEQSPTQIAKAVRDYIKQREKDLPPTVKLATWFDRSEFLQQRMDLLLKNASLGLVLVILVLGLFMELRLAFWVTLGIPISVFGAIMFMPITGVSINMISLFAFILVLGIVVDDAIVVGENIYTHRQMGADAHEAAYEGAVEVGRPVIFSVLTTMAAFAPLLVVAGMMGKFMYSIPVIVILVLGVSLIESLYILPAHLNKARKARDPNKKLSIFARIPRYMGGLLERIAGNPYRKTLKLAIKHRYSTLAFGLISLMLTIGLFAAGFVKVTFMPEIEGDLVRAKLTMPFGTSIVDSERHMKRIVQAARQTVAYYDSKLDAKRKKEIKTIRRAIYAQGGSHIALNGVMEKGVGVGSHLAEVAVFLKADGIRNCSAAEFADRWRKTIGEIAGAEKLDITAKIMHMGEPIDVQLSHTDYKVLVAASEKLKKRLAEYPGLFDIADNYEVGKRELKLRLRPQARALGITQQMLASQVRAAFYGAEALRIQRGRNELKVMVRYPAHQRRSLADVDKLRIRTPTGGEVPFSRAAYVLEGRGYSQIKRVDRRRVVNVTAKANMRLANPREILDALKRDYLPKLMAEYPGMTWDVEGEQREQRESMGALAVGFLAALGLIFGLLAVPSKSYGQPLIIMSAIPFGIIGAVIGHVVLGYSVSLMSMFGVVALAGVVVNDSLVMVDFINRLRENGVPLLQAVLDAGQRRFRAIMLTTLTTFFALVPMITETSVQARFLIPMAISLAFGVLFATAITLVLVPVLYILLDDLSRVGNWLLGRPNKGHRVARAPEVKAKIDAE
ncbi:MAG: efflux RND transporter permease subunit [Myxococcales bacterium]|nr:efflux RND transporter permease subunit [Myxococcales bacterium]